MKYILLVGTLVFLWSCSHHGDTLPQDQPQLPAKVIHIDSPRDSLVRNFS